MVASPPGLSGVSNAGAKGSLRGDEISIPGSKKGADSTLSGSGVRVNKVSREATNSGKSLWKGSILGKVGSKEGRGDFVLVVRASDNLIAAFSLDSKGSGV